MTINYKKFEKEIPVIENLQQKNDATAFFIQECLRFYSISKTLLESNIDLTIHCNANERYLTHILTRSLLENFFTIIHMFDKPAMVSNQYEKLKNSFKKDYVKLTNALQVSPWNNLMSNSHLQLEPSDSNWVIGSTLPDVNSMLTSIRNIHGNRLDYLYVVYRITSFDTHGRSHEAIFNAVFGKTCNFPALNIGYTFELIASEYLALLHTLRNQSLESAKTYRFIS